MARFSGANVIAGGHTMILSNTTIGHTDDGFVVDAPEETFQIFSHESGKVPIAEYTGGRPFNIKVKLLQLDRTMLAIICPDASVGSSGTATFEGLNMNRKKTPKALTLHADALTSTSNKWTFSAVVPATPGLNIVMKKGEKYTLDVEFTQLFTTGNMVTLAIVPAA
jgi:hypothetical protein